MITGFNTDIEHAGVVYHVQTEDKGLDSPLILSLVYAGGTILASKRTPYEDLIAEGFNEDVLAERLKRQHRLICAAINAGRIEDLKQMGARAKAEKQAASNVAQVEQVAEPQVEIIESAFPEDPHAIVFDDMDTLTAPLPPLPEPPAPSLPAPSMEDTLEIRKPRPRARAKPSVRGPRPKPRVDDTLSDTLDGTVTAPVGDVAESPYTVHDTRQEKTEEVAVEGAELVLSLLDDDEFMSGETFIIRVLVEDRSGAKEKPLSGVPVSVKILGTGFRPQMYSVKTQRDGMASVTTEIPWFTSGRAAVLVRADNKGVSTELRRVIHPAR